MGRELVLSLPVNRARGDFLKLLLVDRIPLLILRSINLSSQNYDNSHYPVISFGPEAAARTMARYLIDQDM